MNRDQLTELLHEARTEAAGQAAATTPWAVAVLTGLGAWLAALPLLLLAGLTLGSLLDRGPATYLAGAPVLLAAISLLRKRSVSLFVEQLAVPGLLVGAGLLAFGLFRDMPLQLAAATMSLLACGVAWTLPQHWLRVLLGGAACALFLLIFFAHANWIDTGLISESGRGLNLALALWAAAHVLQRRVLNDGAAARHAAALEALAAGWALALLAVLALSYNVIAIGKPGSDTLPRLISAALALAAAAWLARQWPVLRAGWCAGVAAVLTVLAGFMPALGATLLILAVCAASGRWRLATTAGLAAAWLVGAFYYQLRWPLADKAALLAGAGVLLGALAWLALRGAARSSAPAPAAGAGGGSFAARAGLALSALAVLLVANTGIWQKEHLIAHGQPVYVALAPVDPRSLMQGDYMRLNFNLPGELDDTSVAWPGGIAPTVVARRDPAGIATLLRLRRDQSALAPGEFLFQLTAKDGSWTLVSDAWFFKEGDAARYEKAKYGEFRVDPDGRALLVDMRGAHLERL